MTIGMIGMRRDVTPSVPRTGKATMAISIIGSIYPKKGTKALFAVLGFCPELPGGPYGYGP